MSPSDERTRQHGGASAEWRQFERLAARFYEQRGFQILERNWQAGRKELDLIVRKDSLIAFVEVKSSRSKQFGHPVERVTRAKVRNLTEAAKRYLQENDVEGCDFRFDVVAFVGGRLEYFPGAFTAE